MSQPQTSPAGSSQKSGVVPAYKRVLLKISGEGMSHEGGFGLEADELEKNPDAAAEFGVVGRQR